jgi:hypothetical protein
MTRVVTLSQPPEEVLRWLVLSDPRVARVLGMDFHAILSPGSPDLPFAVFSRQSVDRAGTLASGPSRSSNVAVEVRVYAAAYEEAREIANAIRERIDCYTGEAYGLDIGGIHLTGESDDYVSLGGEQLATAYQVTLSFTVRWSEVA